MLHLDSSVESDHEPCSDQHQHETSQVCEGARLLAMGVGSRLAGASLALSLRSLSPFKLFGAKAAGSKATRCL